METKHPVRRGLGRFCVASGRNAYIAADCHAHNFLSDRTDVNAALSVGLVLDTDAVYNTSQTMRYNTRWYIYVCARKLTKGPA